MSLYHRLSQILTGHLMNIVFYAYGHDLRLLFRLWSEAYVLVTYMSFGNICVIFSRLVFFFLALEIRQLYFPCISTCIIYIYSNDSISKTQRVDSRRYTPPSWRPWTVAKQTRPLPSSMLRAETFWAESVVGNCIPCTTSSAL